MPSQFHVMQAILCEGDLSGLESGLVDKVGGEEEEASTKEVDLSVIGSLNDPL